MLRVGAQISEQLLRNTNIATVEQQIGRAELGEDPWGPERCEFHVELKPVSAEVMEKMADEIRDVRLTPAPLLEPMPPHFRPIAAIAHIAPPAAVVFARIQEQPAAIFSVAPAHLMQPVMVGQQMGAGAHHRPKRLVQRLTFSPGPAKIMFAFRRYPKPPKRDRQFGIQNAKALWGNSLVFNHRGKNSVQSFPQPNRLGEDASPFLRMAPCPLRQRFRRFHLQEFCLSAPRKKIQIGI